MAEKPLTREEIADLKQLKFDLQGIKIFDVDNLVKAMGGIANVRRELEILRRQYANIDTDVNNIYENLKNITSQIKKGNEGYKLTVSAFSRLSSISSKLKADADNINVLNEKGLKSLISKIQLEKQSLDDASTAIDKELARLKLTERVNGSLDEKQRKQQSDAQNAKLLNSKYLRDLDEGYQKLLETANKRLANEENINKALGITGNLALGLEKILGKLGVGGILDTDTINEKIRRFTENIVRSREAAGETVTILDKGKVAFKALKETAGGLAEALDDPALILAEIVKLSFKADTQTTDLAKSFLTTKFAAVGVRQEFVEMSQTITDTYITTDKLIAANIELNKQLGFNKIFSKDINETFVDLTGKIGISAESAGRLARTSITSGKSFKSIEQTILGTVSLMSHQNSIQVDGKEILEETGKIHGQIQLNLKNNPTLIAQAVIQTKLLGTTLETVKGQSEFLLDFESSITSELKAELITGKQLNFEKARSFALSGDLVGVAKELNNQGLTYNKYQQMNIIAQKAYAESLGLTSDQLADQLLQQDAIGKSKSQITQIDGKAAADRLEALSAQEKFNNALDKLKDIVGNLVTGPFGELLDILSEALNIVGLMAKPITLINNLIDSLIGSTSSWASGLKIAAAAAIALGIFLDPVVGLISLAAAGTAIAAFEGMTSKKGDDIISPGSSQTGYGNRTLFGPEGAISLNNKDTIISGTNLNNPQSNNQSTTINNTVDITPLISAINEVRQAVDKLANKEGGVFIDGKKVGNTLVQGSYKVA